MLSRHVHSAADAVTRRARRTGGGPRRAAATAGLALLAGLFSAGCGAGEEPAPANRAAQGNAAAGDTFRKSDDGSITATPNPVPAGEGKGSTQISWQTKGDVGAVKVYVSENGQPEALVAQNPGGTLEAPWIQTGHTYEFRLYAEKDGSRRLLDRVQVVRGQ